MNIYRTLDYDIEPNHIYSTKNIIIIYFKI